MALITAPAAQEVLAVEGQEEVMAPYQEVAEPLIAVAAGVAVVMAHPMRVEAQAAPASSFLKLTTHNPMTKTYRLYGVDTAMALLRPGAKWEISNSHFTRWDDPRPCPTWQEVQDTMEKIKAFEDSINTIYTEEQIKEHNAWTDMINKAAA